MTKDEAKKIINTAFNSEFVDEKFQKFVENLFKEYTVIEKIRENQYVKDSFKSFVHEYKIIGYFEDNEGNEIDILKVILNKNTSLERARTTQRNFIANYLKTNNKEAALVAFISPENKDWRFSFVKLEHTLFIKDDELKTKEEITPAKRWSFLVGENEGSHTAQSRFVNLLISDEKPNLAELELAFNIEIVTKEFFAKYTELFLKMKEHLDDLLKEDDIIRKDFEQKEISTADFAKKTLGQIVFLYFLQKKGWFGVNAGNDWGTGNKRFMRRFFDRRKEFSDYKNNFFNDILEPLFYEGLSTDIGNDSIYDRLNLGGQKYKMPFLNGGLFSPMNDYSWKITDIIIPDDFFSNDIKTKEGDVGDGIFDIFDRYNFTVNENEPLEKEVAVDPEMLGKVFENLLEITDRKSKGAFYTPREIVHYMCQESLINYLETETKSTIPHKDLEFFIHKGDIIIENDKIALKRKKERYKKYGKNEFQDRSYFLLLPELIRENAKKLDKLLNDIKVVDPAVGSGAFPLGMINEIVRARKVLNIYLDKNISEYELKLHTISNSIYGVDIDPGAVEIAKLRLWLSLVVDEETPHPLPNLEHKIMQGNSLISEFEGINLFDDSFLEDSKSIEKEEQEIQSKLSILQKEYFDLYSNKNLTPTRKTEIEKEIKFLKKRLDSINYKELTITMNASLFGIEDKQKVAQEKIKKLQSKIKQYISESQPTKKQNLKKEIDNLKWELIEATLKEQGKLDKLADVKKYRKSNKKPFFIWKLEFSDVFKENEGFDVVIGNPPYGVSIKADYRDMVIRELGKVPDYEIYYYFIELSKKLLKNNGIKSYIIPNTFLFNVFAADYRKQLLEDWHLVMVIDCTAFKLFESATVHNVITVFQREEKSDKKIGYKQTLNAKSFLELFKRSTSTIDKQMLLSNNTNWGLVFRLSSDYLKIISKIKLFGNNLSVIFPEISQGLIAYDKYKGQNKEIIKNRAFHYKKKSKDSLKEWLWGEDITPYRVDWNKNEYIDYCGDIANPRNPKFFRGRRILIREITNPKVYVGFTDKEQYHDPAIITVLDNENKILPLLGILNSKLATFYHFNSSPKATKGAFPKILVKDIKEFPLPNWEESQKLIPLVNQILTITSTPDYDPKNPPIQQKKLEAEIDKMVYDLYGLTEKEIEIIEEK